MLGEFQLGINQLGTGGESEGDGALYAHAQAQALIKQTYSGFAQAQADILQTYQGYGQANAMIVHTHQGYGQSQSWIEQVYNVHAQAQAKINAFDVNAFGQAQASITFTGGHGQAQALIGTFHLFGRAVIGTSGLVSYWSLNETSGTAFDQWGNNDLTLTGTVTRNQSSLLSAINTPNASYDFGGGRLTVTDNSTLDLGDVVSIIAVVKSDTISGNHSILSKGSGAYYLRYSGNKLQFLRSQVANIVSSTVNMDTGTHFVAVTKNGSTVKLYVDGVDVTGTVTNSTLVNNSQPLGIGIENFGAGPTFTESWDGRIDEVALFSSALTADQIAYFSVLAIGQRQHAQAQARIKNTYSGFGQAAALIDSPIKQGFGQARALIPGLSVYLRDSFTRTTGTNELGPPDIGPDYDVNFELDNGATHSYTVDGSTLVFDVNAPSSGNSAAIGFNSPINQADADLRFRFRWPTDSSGAIYAELKYDDFFHAAYIFINRISFEIGFYGDFSSNSVDQSITLDPDTWYWVRLQTDGNQIHGKYWLDGGSEPEDWTLNLTNTDSSTVSVSGGVYLELRIANDGNSPANQNILLDDINVQAPTPTYRGYAQAQAVINRTFNGFGQAQALLVSVVQNAYGQAQGYIKGIDVNQYGQAQALILQTYQAYGQARAVVVAIRRKFAQAQAMIKNPYRFGQAQAIIYRPEGYGQANSLIVKTANIKHAQAQAMIAKGLAWGQAMADIKKLNNSGFANAKAYIRPRVGLAQAQASIYRPTVSMQTGQARAFIVKPAGYGQAQAKINAVGVRAYGNAQAKILAAVQTYAHAQALGYIRGPAIGQAQALITGGRYLVKYNGYQLPGYAQTERFDSVLRVEEHQTVYDPTDAMEDIGLQNKTLSVTMKVIGENYLDCKNQVLEAATIAMSSKRFTKLYIGYTDRYYMALVKKFSATKSVSEGMRTMDYTVEFEAEPVIYSDTTEDRWYL